MILSPLDYEALLINTRRMTELQVDARTANARIGAGLKWGAVLEAAGPHGLAPLVGTALEVIVTGYVTAGGLALLGREFGFAADHVRELDLVTADGQLRKVTADEHPDLFWAVRGGKGNFGIVTSIETGLMPVERLHAGGLFFPGDATERVLSTWLDWTVTLPEEMSTSVALLRFPDREGVPPQLRGVFLAQVRIAYTGPEAECERLLQPLRAMEPLKDTVEDIPHARLGDKLETPTEPMPIRDRGTLLRDLNEEAVERLAAHIATDDELPPFLVEIRLLGGALSRVPDPPNAIGNRDARFSLMIALVTPPENVPQADSVAQAMIESLGPWDTGAALPSFQTSAATHPDDVRTAYRDADWKKLAAIKEKYDPDNLFRINHNIPPAR